MRQLRAKSRQRKAQGENSPFAELDAEIAEQMRGLQEAFKDLDAEIAALFSSEPSPLSLPASRTKVGRKTRFTVYRP